MSSQDTTEDSELEASLRSTRQAYRRKSQGLSDTTNYETNSKDKETNPASGLGFLKDGGKSLSTSSMSEKFSTLKSRTLSFGGFIGKKVSSAGSMSIPSASTVLAAAKSATSEAASLLMTEVPNLITEAKQVLKPYKDLDTPSFSLAVSKGLGPSAIHIWGGRVHCC
eukprot:CAMPEP_0172155774 /NCGR_PEP_ID=MMETSP1050-20130122/2814_1 /TAXON_ID=233186 /ORGANISM="Cryptomonas curvata, Strain CCAP979/52" /LENGTH=166 /DNA_ID=CAMNT_0012824713 /DNA_START=45 /DNA_END=542 /DNA_ORIENTATION=+